MPLGFKTARRQGVHYELADLAVRRLRTSNLLLKGPSERHFELSVVSHLQASRRLKKNLITQVGEDEVEKIHQASLFGFKHRPDVSIGLDGTAIEIKVIDTSSAVREILGQAIAYRMEYRFVILVLVDQTDGREVVELCQDKSSREYRLLRQLSDGLNIFSVVGPVAQSRNVVFI